MYFRRPEGVGRGRKEPWVFLPSGSQWELSRTEAQSDYGLGGPLGGSAEARLEL